MPQFWFTLNFRFSSRLFLTSLQSHLGSQAYRELLQHPMDHIVQSQEKGIIECPRPCTMEDSHHKVEKIWHNSDTTKTLWSWWKDEEKTCQGGVKWPAATLKKLQEFLASISWWLRDNNLPSSSDIWALLGP